MKTPSMKRGQEAEELRSGIEAIIEKADADDSGVQRFVGRLQELIDRVDARDSLAFLEKHNAKVRDAALDAALEEAAKACEAVANQIRAPDEYSAADACAAEIRALKRSGP